MTIPNADTTTLPGVVIPEAFKQPDWVEADFKIFTDTIKADYNKNNLLNIALVRKLFNQYILGGKLKASFPLHDKNVSKLLEKMYPIFGSEEFQWRYMLIYRTGFFLSSLVSISFTPEALVLPDKFKKERSKLIDEYKKKKEESNSQVEIDKTINWINKEFNNLALRVLDYFREHREVYPIIDSLDSGAKGKPDDFRKLLVAIGLSINARGEINDVVDRSGSEGLSPTQFFNYSSQAIVSQYKKSSETAIPGYLIRQLNTIMVGVKLSKTIDCQTKGRLSIHIQDKDMLKSMVGKIYEGGVLSEDDTSLIGKRVKLRSPLYCKAEDGICHKCYCPDFIERMHLETNAGIGLLSSTAQANMLTSITLKAAHTGLSIDKIEVNLQEDVFEFCE